MDRKTETEKNIYAVHSVCANTYQLKWENQFKNDAQEWEWEKKNRNTKRENNYI